MILIQNFHQKIRQEKFRTFVLAAAFTNSLTGRLTGDFSILLCHIQLSYASS